MLLAQQLAQVASQNLNRAAIQFQGKEISYADLRTRVARLSYLFQHEIGYAPKVGFFASNAPATAISFFAISNIKGLSVFLNPSWSLDELKEAAKLTGITHLMVTGDKLGAAREFIRDAHLNLQIVEIERKQGGEYDTSYSPPHENPPKETDAILLLRTTTGQATGKPRWVAFNHKQVAAATAPLRSKYHIQGTDRMLTTMHWSHSFAFVHGMLFPLMVGATVVCDLGMEGREFLTFLRDAKVTRIADHPPFFMQLLVNCKNEKLMPTGIRSITVGLGHLRPEAQKIYGMLKIPVSHCYGQTENLWSVAMGDIEHGSEGPTMRKCALPGFKYKVLDENGDELTGDGPREGPLGVMSPTVMSGYFGPEKEKETKNVIRGTWLYTHDIVRLEGDGDELSMTFIGRKEDVVPVGTEFSNPEEIGATLRRIAGVDDAAAFTILNSKKEPMVIGVIVKPEGSTLTEQQVIAFCQQHGSGSLMPSSIGFAERIQRDPGGNVIASKLRIIFSHLVS